MADPRPSTPPASPSPALPREPSLWEQIEARLLERGPIMIRNGRHFGRSLEVQVKNGQLVIAIGVQTLAQAVIYADWANPFDEKRDDYIRTFAITDALQFAKDVAQAMLHEREDGSSPLSDFLDAMGQAAIDDGSLGLDERFDHCIKHGQTSPLETWAAETIKAAHAEHGEGKP